MVKDLNSQSFDETVRNSEKPVIIQVWAPWCAPCAMFKPVINEIEEDYGDKVVVARLNIDDEPELTQQLNIMDIPTVLVFKNGRREKLIVGAHPKDKMINYLGNYIV